MPGRIEPGRIELPPELAEAIHAQAAAAAPQECCGLLEGARLGGVWRVTALHPARNLAESADRFAIDPADHFTAARLARANGRTIIGCYHSHPGGRAEPSSTDLAGAAEDGFLWLIAAGARIGAFVYSGGRFVKGADWVTSSE